MAYCFCFYVSHRKTYYDIDEDGWILADSRGNLVISYLKGLMDVYMLRHMFTNWKRVPYEDKRVLQDILNERYVFPIITQFAVHTSF